MSNFKIYNKCLISNLTPHEVPNTSNIYEEIKANSALLARWTTNFDEYETSEWWYLIKDDEYSKDNLKSKDRYEINKGIKNFEIKKIDPLKYKDELFNIYNEANIGYSKLSNNIINKDNFIKNINTSNIYIGAFDKENDELSAYSICKIKKDSNNTKTMLDLSVIKSIPSKKSKGVNAALLDFICTEYLNKKQVDYICDGERAIRHITNFQDYLIKYFGFRKSYCKLNMVYNKNIKVIIKIIFPFRKIIEKIGKYNKFIYNIHCILVQEEIKRTFIN